MLTLPSVDTEPLLLPAIAMAATGAGLILLLIQRYGSLRHERLSLDAIESRIEDLDGRTRASLDMLGRLPDPVVERDRQGRVTFANEAYDRLLAETDTTGCAARRHTPLVVETGTEAVRPDGTRLVEEAIRTPDGIRWYAWAERDGERDGQPVVLRSGREITDRVASERSLEEARAKAEAGSEAKSRFLATVSHEFRTPLNGILGMSDLLLDTSLDPEQQSYVGAIRSSADAFMSLVGEILDFSKIEAGRIDLADEPFDLEALVQGMVELLSPRAQDKGIEIACFVAADVPRIVEADRDRLRQVLFNLAGNAVKFTETGGVGISVERGPGHDIAFRVQDTGPGIPADRLPVVFDDFEQGGLRAARAAGTGLGLGISRRIADRMGGRIEAASEAGRGSTFTLHLPLADRAATPPPRREAEGLRVLLLGPSPFGPAFLGKLLAEAGAETARAETAEDAVDLLRAMRFDVLIADWSLGAGMRAVSTEAKRAGVGRTIVLLSPFERRDVGSPHAAGFDAYLIKPVRSRSLFEQLRPEPQARLPAPTPGRPDARRPTASACRVLLAEDNEINALLAMKALEKLGGLVDWVKDGIEALDHALAGLVGERQPYDLILMDMRMPGLDGFEVTRRIREWEAASGREDRCRIVALTASLIGERERYSETAGFDGFLTKPFTFEALASYLPSRPEPVALAS